MIEHDCHASSLSRGSCRGNHFAPRDLPTMWASPRRLSVFSSERTIVSGKDVIARLATALEVDADELLILARKIPEGIRKRVMERPDAFRRFAELDDKTIDRLLEELEKAE